MEPYFESMAAARAIGLGPDVKPPALSANVTLPGVEVFVDLAELIDIEAEIVRKKKELEKLDSLIAAKTKKLANEKFVQRAPAAVVQQERDSLRELQDQHVRAELHITQCIKVSVERGQREDAGGTDTLP